MSASMVLIFTSKVRDVSITFISVIIFSYILIHYVLQEFIYRKVKLIYKFISNTRATQREEFYNQEILPQKSLDEVKEDVRLAELVSDLDEISKLESNRIPILKQEFVIQDLIKDVYQELSQKASLKGIKLTLKKGCESPIEVFADKQKIKQVLVNLIENSIKYGKQNGETSAGIYEVDNKTIFTEITDNGTGISEEHVLRVFERFYRTDTARSRSEGGTGLGLAIVKHIIEAHGHSVNCRSKLDVGSSFGFTLDKAVR
ncbi:MAG: hypothetical protein IPG85_08730 [Bacteroidetes bacterium]|nr:hypothetical protein [Bacteroidota bacterium]